MMLTPVRICAELISQGSQIPPNTNNILLSLSLAVLTFSLSYQFLGKIMFETLKVKATFDFTEGLLKVAYSLLGIPLISTYKRGQAESTAMS